MLFVAFQENMAQETPNVIQEEESAEVYLEEYTDEFQNTFFEALKQKGIQNYDRAINLLLECKQLQPENSALDHELAKVYFLDKKYVPAQQYAIEALIAEPENYWFLDNLANISERQGITFQSLENTIPFENESLRTNLAKRYFKKKNYKDAKHILSGLTMNPERLLFLQKVNDSLNTENASPKLAEESVKTPKESRESPLESLRLELKKMVLDNDNKLLERESKKALENYPLQPDFYYYHGLAAVRMKKYQEGISILEEGLDYIFDNDSLANEFYKELANAYSALGNSSKANSYLSKVKSGFQ